MKLRGFAWNAAAATGMAALVSAAAWPRLPTDARIAIHWTAGEPDRFAGRTEALVAFPALLIALTGLFLADAWWRHRRDPEGVDFGARPAVVGVTLWIFALLHLAIIGGALGHELDVSTIANMLAGIACVVTGNLLPTTGRNRLVGIRVRWTLESERAWKDSNRLAGRLFVLVGAIQLSLTPLVTPLASTMILLGGLGVAVVAVSWRARDIWKGDPAVAGR